MSRDFLAEFRANVKVIDQTFNEVINKTHEDINKTIKREQAEKYYNVHKRSLPVGLDKVVFVGLTKDEAYRMINDILKPRIQRKRTTDIYGSTEESGETVVYYDAVPENATNEEKSVYYNVNKKIVDENLGG